MAKLKFFNKFKKRKVQRKVFTAFFFFVFLWGVLLITTTLTDLHDVAGDLPIDTTNTQQLSENVDPCVKTYANANYPDLSFNYSDCVWTLTENTVQKSGSYFTYINLVDINANALNINLQATAVMGGAILCDNDSYSFLDGSRGRTDVLSTENTYSYYDIIYTEGTADYSDLKTNFGADYIIGSHCHSDIPFLTRSNYSYPQALDPHNGENMNAMIHISFLSSNSSSAAASLKSADTIVKNLTL